MVPPRALTARKVVTNPPKINTITLITSGRAIAFIPPHNEYTAEKSENPANPVNHWNPMIRSIEALQDKELQSCSRKCRPHPKAAQLYLPFYHIVGTEVRHRIYPFWIKTGRKYLATKINTMAATHS